MFDTFPREVGKKRTVVANMEKFLEIINFLNGKDDVYTTVWSYKKLIFKEHQNKNAPEYKSARIDKIFLDLDPLIITDNIDVIGKTFRIRPDYRLFFMEDSGNGKYNQIAEVKSRDVESFIKEKESYNGNKSIVVFIETTPDEDKKRFREWCKKGNYEHLVNLSGSGYHCYIGVEEAELQYPEDALKQAIWYLEEEIGFIADPKTHDLARLTRVVNTLNYKKFRKDGKKVFCINLDSSIIDKKLTELQELACEPRKEPMVIFGKNRLDLQKYDEKVIVQMDTEEIDIEVKEMDCNGFNFPPCIKNILANAKNKCDHKDRFVLITYFRDIGLSKDMAISILSKHLRPDRFQHSMRGHLANNLSEIDYYYRRKDLLHASCYDKIGKGYAKEEKHCKDCPFGGDHLYYQNVKW
jgi:hypothetical protein